jgi:hypothetical protein
MKSSLIVLTFSAGILAGCGIRLPATDPSSFQIPSDLQTSLDVVYSTDPTFAEKPQDWFGRVGVVRALPDPTTHNLTCSTKGKIDWVVDRVGTANALNFNVPGQTKRIKYKSVVDQKFAAKVDAMKYLTEELDGNIVLKVLLTEVAKQRVTPDEKWQAAQEAFQRAPATNATYFEAKGICYVVTVAGYSYNILTKEKFVKMTSKTGANYAGINVNGEYFNTTEEFALDDVFALSVDILRRPPTMGGSDGVSRTKEERQVTPNDSGFLVAVSQNSVQKPGAWSK